jgi:nucleoside-diphosphate-sugar epimerase
MKVLVTGALGNIGAVTLSELLKRGHQVSAFDLKTRSNKRKILRYRSRVNIIWGDIRNPKDILTAVAGQDVVIHLAAVIPHLSATGVNSEDRPDFAESVNVGGTKNVIDAILSQTHPAKLILGSSLHVFGRTQKLQPPRRSTDPVAPVEHYAHHKVKMEQMVRTSPLVWSIFRFAAALPIRLIIDPGMFNVPLDNRIEYVHSKDVAVALCNALECEQVWGRTLLIGGGKTCQFYYRDLMKQVLGAAGMDEFPEQAFTREEFSTDWLDTEESQRLLNYQQRTLKDYVKEMRAKLGGLRYIVMMLRPLIARWLLKRSPYFR